MFWNVTNNGDHARQRSFFPHFRVSVELLLGFRVNLAFWNLGVEGWMGQEGLVVASVSRLSDVASTLLTTQYRSISLLKKGYTGFLSHKCSVKGSAALSQPH